MIPLVVPRDRINEAWSVAVPLLEPALAYAQDKIDMFDIWTRCLDGRYSLWLVIDDNKDIKVALITEIIEYPQKRTVSVPFAGGEIGLLEEWLPGIVEAMDKHAAHNGCASVEIHGRAGWRKVLKEYGYVERCITIERELNGSSGS